MALVNDEVMVEYKKAQCIGQVEASTSPLHPRAYPGPGGAGSEVWNRVYMIAPVKKFGRVRLSTIFLQNKYGGECRHGRTMSFCSVLSFAASKHQE